jgi:hypothetical protein
MSASTSKARPRLAKTNLQSSSTGERLPLVFSLDFVLTAYLFLYDSRPVPASERQASQPPLFRQPSPDASDDEVAGDLSANLASLQVGDAKAAATAPPPSTDEPVASTSTAAAAATAAEVDAAVDMPPDDRSLLLSEVAELHLYDKATGMFMLQEKDVQANLWLVAGESFPCKCSLPLYTPPFWMHKLKRDARLAFDCG